ncbi:MAG TPA: T9SS type A sorting domain-containing protein, partial [Flavobacterium sp.]|nr:T9SS type A sorting domain-containing protein [Flavobacterium sp.]
IAITAQPEDAEAAAGSDASFEVDAANVEEYQWQVSTNGTDWADISNGGTAPAYSGADTDELTITNVPAGYDGYLYRAMLVNGDDCTTYSSEVELSVTEVTANTLLAVNDDFSATTILEGTEGLAGDVTANDLFNGEPANDLLIAIALTEDGGIEGVAIDSDGNLSVPATALDGTYTVTYSICEAADDTNCSTATAIVVVTAVAGVADHDAINVTLYPNPATDMLYLHAGKDILVQGIEIYNMQGRRMLSFTGGSETFNISSLSAGIYMVQVKTDKGLAINKLVKN